MKVVTDAEAVARMHRAARNFAEGEWFAHYSMDVVRHDDCADGSIVWRVRVDGYAVHYVRTAPDGSVR